MDLLISCCYLALIDTHTSCRLICHIYFLRISALSLYTAQVLTSSFSATSPHQDTVTALYEVLNVLFFYAVCCSEIQGLNRVLPCCSAGSVSLAATSLLVHR